ncbi:MAG: hypothetical protein Tsb0013_22030 [Phycisphaerales bacterium]
MNSATSPAITVIVPTRGRVEMLERCLRALDQQEGAPAFETIVTVDGPDAGESEAARRATNTTSARVLTGPPRGPAVARNRAIESAQAPLLLLLNDDVVPAPTLLREHLRAHEALDRDALVLGSSPWQRPDDETLFDRMVFDTSTIFFYDTMDRAEDRHSRDWGYRHAWTLNLSIPTRLARSCGAFSTEMSRPVYEDLEFAWRATRSGAPVTYHPDACVVHHHRYTPGQLLRRDVLLGHQAARLAQINPACARDMFGRDVLAFEERDRADWFVRTQRSAALRSAALLHEAAALPCGAIDGDHPDHLLRTAYQSSLLARRACWHAGLLAAHDGVPVDALDPIADEFTQGERTPVRHPERIPAAT